MLADGRVALVVGNSTYAHDAVDMVAALQRLEDATWAGYLAELLEQGRAPSSASTAVAAARFRARLAGEPSPAGERTDPGAGGLPADHRRARPGSVPFGAADLAAVLATCHPA